MGDASQIITPCFQAAGLVLSLCYWDPNCIALSTAFHSLLLNPLLLLEVTTCDMRVT